MRTSNWSDTRRNFYLNEANQLMLGLLAASLIDHEPVPEEICALLTFADEAGLDWKELYQFAVEEAKEMNNTASYPPISEVSPNARRVGLVERNAGNSQQEGEDWRAFVEYLRSAKERQIR